MKAKIRPRRPSPALVIAIIALIAATAGTAVAAIGIGNLSPGAKNKLLGVSPLDYNIVPITVPANSGKVNVQAPCQLPTFRGVLAGGVDVGAGDNVQVLNEFPYGGADGSPTVDDGWRARVVNATPNPQVIKVYAICARTKVVNQFGTP
jgi:hypothetical protein